MFEGQDPYLVHYGRVNFDGTGLVWLTTGHGNHTLSYSPDRRYVIDSYSRVDLPTVSETAQGRRWLACVANLKKGDASALMAEGWTPPEVFSARAEMVKRIFGGSSAVLAISIGEALSVIEDIYAGPHGAHVPSRFRRASVTMR